jgi:hypothetical protein
VFEWRERRDVFSCQGPFPVEQLTALFQLKARDAGIDARARTEVDKVPNALQSSLFCSLTPD